MKRITIKNGTIGDLPQVLDLINELAAYTGFSDQVVNTVEQMEIDGFGPNPIYELLVAKSDQTVLGVSVYYYRFSTWKGKRLYLEDFVVRESERGKGIGKLLFEATLQKSLSENCTGIMWQVLGGNNKAINFYKKYDAKFDNDFINCNLEMDMVKSILS